MKLESIDRIKCLSSRKPVTEALLAAIELDPGSVQPVKVHEDPETGDLEASPGSSLVLEALSQSGCRIVEVKVVGFREKEPLEEPQGSSPEDEGEP